MIDNCQPEKPIEDLDQLKLREWRERALRLLVESLRLIPPLERRQLVDAAMAKVGAS
jgi:hypothetical protein